MKEVIVTAVPEPEDRANLKLQAALLKGEGWTLRRIADHLGASKSAVDRWLSSGHPAARPMRLPRVTEIDSAPLPVDATIGQIAQYHSDRVLTTLEDAVLSLAVPELTRVIRGKRLDRDGEEADDDEINAGHRVQAAAALIRTYTALRDQSEGGGDAAPSLTLVDVSIRG